MSNARETSGGQGARPSINSLLLVGEIAKPHGVRGEVKILAYSGEPDNICHCRTLILAGSDGAEQSAHALRKCRRQGMYAIVSLAGIDSRDAAEELTGRAIWVPRHELPALAADEFYWQDLQGMEVVTVQGQALGKVTGFLGTGGHDILVITGAGREYMIPAVAALLAEIDRNGGRIVVDPPDGLLEMNG